MPIKRYPWDAWLSKRRTVLIRGIDYWVSHSTMAQMLRNNASYRGLSLQLQETDSGIVVEVRNAKILHTNASAVLDEPALALGQDSANEAAAALSGQIDDEGDNSATITTYS